MITAEQARAQGSTPSSLRVLANSLDRRAKAYHEYADHLDKNEHLEDYRDLRRQATINKKNAADLRRLAMEL